MSSALSNRAHVTVVTGSGESVAAPRIYTMTELNQQTARVLEEVNRSGEPAVITRHGRFVCLLTPLAAADVESTALSRGPVADDVRSRERRAARTLTADEAEAEVDTWS